MATEIKSDYYLIREKTINNAVIGTLYDMKSENSWVTLENKNCIIPCGEYHFKLRQSPKFGLTPWLYDIVGREYILMHTGNYSYDSRGCILIGNYNNEGSDYITGSKVAFTRLMNTLMSGKDYTIQIEWQLF